MFEVDVGVGGRCRVNGCNVMLISKVKYNLCQKSNYS